MLSTNFSELIYKYNILTFKYLQYNYHNNFTTFGSLLEWFQKHFLSYFLLSNILGYQCLVLQNKVDFVMKLYI